jgi:hypothetical protein
MFQIVSLFFIPNLDGMAGYLRYIIHSNPYMVSYSAYMILTM